MAAGSRSRTAFTTRASCLIAAGCTAVLCGLLLGIVDLARAGVLAVAVPLLSALVVLRSQVQLANRRTAEPPHAAAGDTVVVNLTISNRSLLPMGALMLEDQLPGQLSGNARFALDSLRSRETRTVSYRMPRLPRGHYRTGPLNIRLTDPFHLVDLRRSFTATNEVVDHPDRRAALLSRAAAVDRRRRRRRQPLDRSPRRGRRVHPRVPHRRRPAQDPLALVRAHRGADGAPGGAAVAGRGDAAARPAHLGTRRRTEHRPWARRAAAQQSRMGGQRGREHRDVHDPRQPRRRPDLRPRGAGPGADGHRRPAQQLPCRRARFHARRPHPVPRRRRLPRARVHGDRGARRSGRRRACACSPRSTRAARPPPRWRSSWTPRPGPTVRTPRHRRTTRPATPRRASCRSAGWQVGIARCGDSVAEVWRTLLAYRSVSAVRTGRPMIPTTPLGTDAPRCRPHDEPAPSSAAHQPHRPHRGPRGAGRPPHAARPARLGDGRAAAVRVDQRHRLAGRRLVDHGHRHRPGGDTPRPPAAVRRADLVRPRAADPVADAALPRPPRVRRRHPDLRRPGTTSPS